MPSNYQHIQRYKNFYGIDLKSNDLEFPEKFANDVDNIQFLPNGTIEKRKGYQPHSEPGGKFGIFTYNRIDSSGVEQPEVIGISNTIQKLATTSMVVTYTGPTTNAVSNFKIVFDVTTDQYRCIIEENTAVVLDLPLGLGRDVGVPVSVNSLASAINAIAGGNYTATVTGVTSTPASFIKTVPMVSLINNPVTCIAKYWTSLNVSAQTGKAGPLQGSETNKNASNFENATAVQVKNCIYISNGYDPVLKYDGQNVYRAGLPPASDGSTGTYTISTSGGGAGANVYVWRQQFVQIDATGNLVEGNPFNSAQFTGAEPSASPVTVTVSNIQAGSGFNTNCAIVAGAQVAVTTIQVDNGSGGVHTMKVGDTAYFFDSVSGGYVERQVTAVNTTIVPYTITIAGAAVTVADNAVISNNLRIKILRNRNTGVAPVLHWELVEIPNNSFTVNQTFTDNRSDASLVAEFIEPVTDRSPPVPGKYISAYQSLMVTAGNISAPNQVSFSDIENPEYFALVSNQFDVTNLQGDIITGIHPASESFIIFQSRAIHAVTGDVPNQTFRVDVITQDVGCAAHATIQDVRGTICFLSNVGPRVMVGASLPKGLGTAMDNPLNSRLDPLFSQRGLESEQVLQLKRAIGFNDRLGEKYFIFIPTETVESGGRYTNANSKTLVYDYTRDAWVIWTNLDMTGGVTSFDSDKEIYFVERRDSAAGPGTTSVQAYLYRFQNSGTFLDYQDHDEPVSVYYKSSWEFMGNPAVLKNFQRIKIYSAENVDSTFRIQIETERNFIPDAVISTCSLTFEANGYGSMAYGDDEYGSPSVTDQKHKLSNGRCMSLRVILSNDEAQTNVAITGYELEMSLPYKPGFKI